MTKNDTALILFSRSANAEAAAKSLGTNTRSAQLVASFLINRSKKIVSKTDLPTFFFSEKEQQGRTFGERFANAFSAVFALGFERVIAIGNDCLTLETADILTAARALKTTPSVLGETSNGGAYLIGFHKSIFQKKAFQNIDWQTKDVFNQLIQFIDNQESTPFFLNKKSDINQRSDWQKVLPKVALHVKKALLKLLQIHPLKASVSTSLPINYQFLAVTYTLRAPPVF
jgi:uncharacterized protein